MRRRRTRRKVLALAFAASVVTGEPDAPDDVVTPEMAEMERECARRSALARELRASGQPQPR